jgi:tetratricopeptide (TPR) repeat protein
MRKTEETMNDECRMMNGRKLNMQFCILHFAFCISLIAGCSSNQPPEAPPQAPSSLVAANSALISKQPDAAIADAQAYLRNAPNGIDAAQAWYLEGCGYEMKVANGPGEMDSDLSHAEDCYKDSLTASPSAQLEGDVRASLSNVDYFQDKFADAIQQATMAISLTSSPKTKSFLLYRIGLSQQRLGLFEEADKTFRQVDQRYSTLPVATAAREHEGLREFYVQLATFNDRAAADRAAGTLHSSGVVISQRTDSKGNIIIDDGPFASYSEAKKAKVQLQTSFPQSVIVP